MMRLRQVDLTAQHLELTRQRLFHIPAPFSPLSLIKHGHIQPRERLFRLTDDAGKTIMIHGGSLYWNDYRKRWIMIGLESFWHIATRRNLVCRGGALSLPVDQFAKDRHARQIQLL